MICDLCITTFALGSALFIVTIVVLAIYSKWRRWKQGKDKLGEG